MRAKTLRPIQKKPAKPHKNSKKKKIKKKDKKPIKPCFCQTDPDFYRSKPCDWDELLEIPGIKDVTLISNDKYEFQTCKILLATLGPKIAKLLQKSTVRLNCSLSVIQTLHTFTLNGEFKCDSTTLEPLLRAAKHYNMSGIKLFGGLFMMTLINGSNVIEMLQLSSKLLCPHFENQIKSYILDNFEELGKQESFLRTCTPMWMEEFVKNELLNASEENIFEILMAWTDMSKEREKIIPDIAKHIRFSIMDKQFFKDVVLTSKPFFEKAKTEILRRRGNRVKNHRIPHELVFSMGGFSSEPCSAVELYNVRSNTWTTLNQDFVPHAYHGMVAMDKKIFVLGGFGDSGNGAEYFQSTFCFDLQSKTWTRKSSMNNPRCYVSVAELNGKIYCIGGFDGAQRFSSVECFDPDLDQWASVKSMNHVRSDSTAVTYGNKIIVIGGFNGETIIPDVEIYDPDKDEWTSGPDMREPRSGLKAVVFNDKLYAIGGFNGNARLRSVECLDLLKRDATWTSSTQLITPRSNFGATVVDKKILVTGN